MSGKRSRRGGKISAPASLALATGIVVALGGGDASAQATEQNPSPEPNPRRAVPEGFEDIDSSVETIFDVYFQGIRVAAAPGRLMDGKFIFRAPDVLAQQLPGVDVFKTSSFLRETLPSHEEVRCPPGETIDCGVLLNGISGVIVDPDRFRVDIFLSRELLLAGQGPMRIQPPVSGVSVIQGIGASVSANNNGSDNFRAGVEFTTLASVGRTSLASRIYGDTSRGFQVDEAYVQHFENEQRWAAGLFNSEATMSATTMRVAGVRLSSFHGETLDQNRTSATALEIVLPRPARVEIYRDGILISSAQYPGGLQFLDTSRLPEGSYPVRVVVRDASGVILDEVRTFTRAADLPPEGKLVYGLSAGVRMTDTYSALASGEEEREAFLPESTDELVLSASAGYRIAPGLAAGISVTSIDGEIYPEASLQGYYGNSRGFLSVASGPDGQYGAVAGATMQFGEITTTLDARVVEASPQPTLLSSGLTKYRPFMRDEQSISASVQAPFWEGFLGLRTTYGAYEDLSNRHYVGLSYTQPASIPWLGSGVFRFEASTSDMDTRVGFRFTLMERIDSRSARSAAVGLENIDRGSSGGIQRSGLFPVAQVGYSRDLGFDDAQVMASGLAGVSEGRLEAQASLQAMSHLGEADITVGARDTQDSTPTDAYLTGNLRTGFVYGDGALHLGRSGYGDAAVLVKIDEEKSRGAHDGRFQVVIDGLPGERLRVGESAAISLQSFTQPKIALSPDAAPPFDIDLTPRVTPLYPGNVVSLKWQAIRVVTAYGRLVDEDGQPVEGAIVAAGNDVALTGEGGYFALTAPIGSTLSLRERDNTRCQDLAVLPDAKSNSRRAVVNLGQLVCPAQRAPAVAINTESEEPADAESRAVPIASIEPAKADPVGAETTRTGATILGVLGRMIASAQAEYEKQASREQAADNIAGLGIVGRLIARARSETDDHEANAALAIRT